jgi:type VI protein secretion system component VasK
MVLLGVILVLLAAGAGVLLFLATAQITDTVDISILGGTLSLPPLTLLITGMVLISLFWLGWAMLRGGLRRAKRRRLEAKEAAAAAEARRVEDERRMQEEFAARERELVDERRRRDQETAALRAQEDTAHAESRTDATRVQRNHPDTVGDDRPATTTGTDTEDVSRPAERRDTRQV